MAEKKFYYVCKCNLCGCQFKRSVVYKEDVAQFYNDNFELPKHHQPSNLRHFCNGQDDLDEVGVAEVQGMISEEKANNYNLILQEGLKDG